MKALFFKSSRLFVFRFLPGGAGFACFVLLSHCDIRQDTLKSQKEPLDTVVVGASSFSYDKKVTFNDVIDTVGRQEEEISDQLKKIIIPKIVVKANSGARVTVSIEGIVKPTYPFISVTVSAESIINFNEEKQRYDKYIYTVQRESFALNFQVKPVDVPTVFPERITFPPNSTIAKELLISDENDGVKSIAVDDSRFEIQREEEEVKWKIRPKVGLTEDASITLTVEDNHGFKSSGKVQVVIQPIYTNDP